MVSHNTGYVYTKLDLRSSGLLRKVDWQFVTDISGPIGCPETSVANYQSALRNIPEERRFHLLYGVSLKSRILHRSSSSSSLWR